MPSIAIITDTDCSLPAELAERYDIRQVPITVHFGPDTYRAVYDINDEHLFTRIDRDGELPTTSAPSPGAFAQAYRDAFNHGYESAVCLTVSSEVSATYRSAVAACDLTPEIDVTVLDTRTLTMGQGYMVLAAAEAAQAEAGIDEVLAAAEDVGRRTHLFASLSTLKYLAMSGRVGHLAAGMGDLLGVKPVLTIRGGKLDLLQQVRTQKKAWTRVIDLLDEALESGCPERMSIVHAAALDEARRFEGLLHTRIHCPEVITYTELNPGMSVHGGAGFVGVAAVAAS